jgi:hypothetical protein
MLRYANHKSTCKSVITFIFLPVFNLKKRGQLSAWKSTKAIRIPKPRKPPSDPSFYRALSIFKYRKQISGMSCSQQIELFYSSESHSTSRTIWLP